MTTALAWIRKSKGSDDDIGLQQQRRQVKALANEIADDVDVLDLGVHTGFSSMSRDSGVVLDDLPEVQQAVQDLENGSYDYVVGLDDRRIARDGYMSVIEYAATQGGAEFRYVRDVQRDDLSYDLHRRVERHTKEEEISKSREAIEERIKRGMWQGRPPYGLQFDDNGEYLVPGDKYETVMEIFEAFENGSSLSELSRELELSKGTIHNIKERGREFYEERA